MDATGTSGIRHKNRSDCGWETDVGEKYFRRPIIRPPRAADCGDPWRTPCGRVVDERGPYAPEQAPVVGGARRPTRMRFPRRVGRGVAVPMTPARFRPIGTSRSPLSVMPASHRFSRFPRRSRRCPLRLPSVDVSIRAVVRLRRSFCACRFIGVYETRVCRANVFPACSVALTLSSVCFPS